MRYKNWITLAGPSYSLKHTAWTGIIDQSGRPRRLVDTQNAIDGLSVILRDATVESLANPDEGERRFQLLNLTREAILLAIPLTNLPRPPGAEVMAKKPVPATLMLPGVEVTCHVYLPPEVDPSAVRILSKGRFLPVTEAEVTQITHGAVCVDAVLPNPAH